VPANGSPGQSEPARQSAGDVQPPVEPQTQEGADETSSQPDGDGVSGRLGRRIAGPRAMWAAVAALCVAGGAAGSVLGAHALAGHDEAQARQNFRLSVTSTGIASAVKVALQRDEDLLVAADNLLRRQPEGEPG